MVKYVIFLICVSTGFWGEHNGREVNLFQGEEFQGIPLRGGDAHT